MHSRHGKTKRTGQHQEETSMRETDNQTNKENSDMNEKQRKICRQNKSGESCKEKLKVK